MEKIKMKSAMQQEAKQQKIADHWQKMSASQSQYSIDPDFVADVRFDQ